MNPAIKKTAIALLLIFSLSLSHLIFFAPPARAQGEPGNSIVKATCLLFKTASNIALIFPGGVVGNNLATMLTQDKEWFDQSFCQFYSKVFDSKNPNEMFGERYTYAQVTWIYNSLVSFLLNTVFGTFFGDLDLETIVRFICPGCDISSQIPSSSPLASARQPNSGVMGLIGASAEIVDRNRVSFFFGSLPQFLAKFNLATPASAQGYGYSALGGNNPDRGIQPIWRAFRDMSYFLTVIALVVSGFMIMFRVRMGQTAVTLQLMIPKIIATLIGVTFSFAISGFIIDLVYLSLGFILHIVAATTNYLTSANEAVQYFTDPNAGFARIWLYFNLYAAPATVILGLTLLPGIGFFVFPILFIILLLKLWWAMLKAYAHLIIHIITGPLQILLGLLPGLTAQPLGFGQWLRNVAGYAAVFVVVPLVLLFVMILWSGGTLGGILSAGADIIGISPVRTSLDSAQDLFTPTSLPNMPLFGSGGLFGGVVILYGIGWIMVGMLPSMIDNVPKAFKAIELGKHNVAADLRTAYTGSLAAASDFGRGVNAVARSLRPTASASSTPPPNPPRTTTRQ